MNRSEQERDQSDYVRFDARALKTSRTQEAVVMHPLPRTDELAYELDSDPRAVYFEQAAAGVPVRMALIGWLLENAGTTRIKAGGPQATNLQRQKTRRLVQIPIASAVPKAATCARASGSLPQSAAPSSACAANSASANSRCSTSGHSRSHRYYKFDESLLGYVRQWLEDGTMVVFETRQAG